ncbi:MAG: hypothetical protein WCD79_07900 [Chthoniobacteraceae bacterium]
MPETIYNRSRLTREEIADLELGTTTVTHRLRVWIIAFFLLTIVVVPVIQHILEVRAGKSGVLWPKAANALLIPGHALQAMGNPANTTAWKKIQAANSLFLRDAKAYEKSQEDESFLAVAAMPPMQAFTAASLGLGNEQVYIGRDGWLYYQPEVGYLTNEGFLSQNFLRARARAGNTGEGVQPDPLKAIVQFRDQLAARGIHLLLLPAPVKPMIEPEHLSARYGPKFDAVLQNPSYPTFLKALDAAGVDYLDVSSSLAAEKQRTGQPQFLRTDTHWTPEAMDIAATLLAEKLRVLGISPDAAASLKRGSETIAATGDIAAMLKLPSTSTLYPPQTVTIQPVSKADGSSWTPDASAGVLVLGDSFTNIYSLEAMRWGKSAGFVEQLSFHLRAPVDAIQRNDAGAHATCDLLIRDLAQGHDRLAGKKIVVWEFAMRELAVGDWKLTSLPAVAPHAVASAPAAGSSFFVPEDGSAPVRVTATVAAASKFPRPGSVPYKDHIFCVSLTGVAGPGVPANSRAVVYLWSMKDNVLTPASGWKPGDHVTLDLKSWSDVSASYERLNRSELDDDSLQLEPPCWGEPAK